MGRYAALRALRVLATLSIAVTFVFVLFRIAGDPARQILGDEASTQAIDFFNARYGLDQPIWSQYLSYIASVITGNFGTSFLDGRPVWKVVAETIPNSLLLGFVSFIIAMLIGIPAGIVAALRPGSIWDKAVMSLAIFGFSMPNFFLGILLIFTLTMKLRLLPSAGNAGILHMVMPVATIASAWSGQLARFARASMAETLALPFVAASLTRGQSAWRTILHHALPNATLPTLTIIGFIVGGIIGGTTVVEFVFAWPGMGRLLVTSVQARDLPVVQFIILVITLTMSLTNLAIDLLYGVIDPRIRLNKDTAHA